MTNVKRHFVANVMAWFWRVGRRMEGISITLNYTVSALRRTLPLLVTLTDHTSKEVGQYRNLCQTITWKDHNFEYRTWREK